MNDPTGKFITEPAKCVYHSFVDGPGPCPACRKNNLQRTSTETEHPYRFRYFHCRDCGHTFQSIDVDSRYILEKQENQSNPVSGER